MTGSGPRDRLLALVADAAGFPAGLPPDSRPIAVGWATVELDRAAAELAVALGIPPDRFLDATGTAALGASCRVALGVLPEGVSVALLEPSTEGLLALTLVRLDEGPAAIWLGVPDLSAAIEALRAAGVHASTAGTGPFGPERLVPSGPRHGPHRLLVEGARTIRA